MRRTSLLAVILLIVVSLGVAGGCSDNNNNGNNNGGGGGVGAPDPEAPEFDLELAIELGELSLVAYEQRLECISGGKEAITVPTGYTLEEVIFEGVSSFFNSTCMGDDDVIPIAFIATRDDNIYVVFRGTANFADAISDLAALQQPYMFIPNAGNVSIGFQTTYQGTDDNPIESTILSKLDDLTMTGNFSNLYITGHSLGAALAFLAFPDLSQNVGDIDNVTMYNFAGPAVGDSDWVSAYEGEYALNRVSIRIVNTNDLVPMLPPLGLDCENFEYFHVDNEHEITFGVQLPALPDFADDDCSLVSIGAQLATYGLVNQDDILEDHSMCTYFNTLCAQGSSPGTCSQRAVGCDDGNMNP